MLEQRDDDLWCAQDKLRFLGVDFPIRMGVVRLPDGGLWLWSPVAIDEAIAQALRALGEIRHIVAPNRFHHVHAGTAKDRFPEARLYGAPGLPEKRRDLSFDDVLGDASPEAWGGAFEQVVLRGAPPFNEVIFFHRATGTVFAADLFLNIPRADRWLERLYFGLEGCLGRFAVPRLMHLITWDRARMAADLARIASWPIRRVIVSHGSIVETDAQAAVAGAFTRFLGRAALAAPLGGPTGGEEAKL